MSDELKPIVSNILWSLKDYLPDIVIVGGWVPYFYFQYLFPQQGFIPIKTYDLDLVVNDSIPIKGGSTINEILQSFGFSTMLKTSYSPPITSYIRKFDDQEIELEFLTHQRGNNKAIAIKVQADLSAQALRFTNILYDNTQIIFINGASNNGDLIELEIKIPTPPAYVFNKGLVFARSERYKKRGKDLYYIFDIISLTFPDYSNKIAGQITMLSKNYPAKWLNTFRNNLIEYFIEDKKGVDLVFGQRPSWAFTTMNDEQFKQYIYAVFRNFIRRL